MIPRAPVLAALLAAAQIFAALGSTCATLIFARLMGAEAFGQAMLLIALTGLLSLAVSLNIEGGAMRFMLQGTRPDRAAYRDTSRWLVLGLGGVIGAAVGLLALLQGFGPTTALATALLPGMTALCRLTARLGAALNAVRAATLPRLLSRPLLLGAAACLFWQSGATPTPADLIALVLFAAAFAVTVQGKLLNRHFRHMGPAGTRMQRSWLSTGLAVMPSLLFLELYRDLILTSAALGLDAGSLGALAAALSLTALPGFALVATEVVYAPRIAKAVAASDSVRRAYWLRLAAVTRFSGTLSLSLFLMVLARPIAGFLGPDFDAATPLVPILLLIPMSRMIAGNPVLLLTLSGHSREVMVICGFGAVVTAGTILLVGHSAFVVALVAAVGFALVQLALTVRCLLVTGIDPTGLTGIIGLLGQRIGAARVDS